MITYHHILDATHGLASWLKSKVIREPEDGMPRIHSSKQKMINEVTQAYDNIVGRFDTSDRVPDRQILPPENSTEEKALRKLGAIEEDGQWIVPEELDLEKFERWWPLAPEDLRDTTPRMLVTKDGRLIESMVDLKDQARGMDSSATPLLYGGFVAVALALFALGHFMPLLVIPGLLAFIPFTVAMSHAEGPKEALKCLVVLGFSPLILAGFTSVMVSVMSAVGAGAVETTTSSGMMGILGMVLLVPAVFFVACVVAVIALVFDDNRQANLVGGFFTKLKSVLVWAMVYTGAFIVMLLIPNSLKASVPFLLASLYPMVYVNSNYVIRYKKLKAMSTFNYNLGKKGKLAESHVVPKQRQALAAHKDKSPRFVLGTATGHLTEKHYHYAPDAGVKMVLSQHDLTRHCIVFGATGSGKTESVMKQLAVQWVTAGAGGMLVLDGKGALPGDIKELIDVMVAPGVDFAPFQGLNGHNLAIAINTAANPGNQEDDKNAIWVKGANQFCFRACEIFEALNTHELNYKRHARNKCAKLELEIDALKVEIAMKERRGEDLEADREALEEAQSDLAFWSNERDKPRTWLWNATTLIRVIDMISNVVNTPKGWAPSAQFQAAVKWLGHGVSKSKRDAEPELYHPAIGRNGMLDAAIAYVEKTWCGFEPMQRSSFSVNISGRVLPLTTDPHMVGASGVHWKDLEKGVDAGACLRGEAVGVYLPAAKHRDAGTLVSILVKQRVYHAIAMRGGDNRNWRETETPVLLLMDECQELVGDDERNLLPMARSLGLEGVFATQEFESLIAKFGDETKARQFADTCQSFIKLMTQGRATRQYCMERLGMAPLVKFATPTRGLNYEGAVKSLADSPHNDPNHPGYAVFRDIERQSEVEFLLQGRRDASHMWAGAKAINPEDMDITAGYLVSGGGVIEDMPLLSEAEMDNLFPVGAALLALRRAGEKRIDIANIDMVTEEQMKLAITAAKARRAEREAKEEIDRVQKERTATVEA